MKTIIVTGTSRGIGKSTVGLFLKKGYRVIALSRKPVLFNESYPTKNLKFFSVDFLEDFQSQSGIKAVVDYIESKNLKMDALVNNAGYLVNKPIKDLEATDFLNCYKVNALAPALLIQLFLPYLNKPAHIVNISTMGAVQGSSKFPGLAAYSSTKAALCNLTELLSEELKEQGVKVNALALGAVQTEMLEEAFPGYEAPLTAEEMASYIVDFTLNGSRFYNGKILSVSSTTP